MTVLFSEDALEHLMLEWLEESGWSVAAGASVAPGSGERTSWDDIVLHGSVAAALRNLNPEVPEEYLRQAAAEVLTPQSQDAITENYRLHSVLVSGYRGITYIDESGQQVTPTIRFISADVTKNRYLAVNQVTVADREHSRRFDVVLYVNGLPLSVVELKRSGDEATSAEMAFDQLQTYVAEFPMAFRFAVLVVASDGVTARYGTPFTPWNHFARWNVDEHGELVDEGYHGVRASDLELLVSGLLNVETFGEVQRDYVAFDASEKGLLKRIAKPHQYFAVRKAIDSTVRAVDSDGRAGVVWHTQGSGKSMEMELFTAKVMRHPRLANPTIIVITDRTELDNQLSDSFTSSTLLPEKPQKVVSRAALREELAQRRTGGIYFTTLQKFGLTEDEKAAGQKHPLLSDRRNIIVIVDEAHRSHYDNIDGYAAHLKSALPHATLIAFTGTPIAEGERDTRRVFGDDIDTYDLLRAVEDGATVPVAFEPRLIKLERAEGVRDVDIDDAAEEATESLDEADRDRLQKSVAVLNTVYGSPQRLKELAGDLVKHWEVRRDLMQPFIGGPGKAMVVCSTRENAAKLYEEIIALRPDWHNEAPDKGVVKVVYTGSASDKPLIRQHVLRPSQSKAVKNRIKDIDDELELVIVKDMMLTGFDAPPLHTIYLDRPLKGALLMQTLARVNRTFGGKRDGLLVAYAPVTDNLAAAMREWTQTTDKGGDRGSGTTATEAAEVAMDAVEELRALVGTEWKALVNQDPKRGWIRAIQQVATMLLSPKTPGNIDPQRPNKRLVAEKFKAIATGLARAYAIAANMPEMEPISHEVRFYEEVRVWMAKLEAQDRIARGEPLPEDVRRLLGDIIVTSTSTEGVIDIYKEAGLERPRLDAVRGAWTDDVMKRGRAELAIEALKATLLAESGKVTKYNEVRKKVFSERVNELMNRYANQQLTAAEVIAAMAEMADDIIEEAKRGEQFDPPLEEDELTFYDLIAQNESAVDVLGGGVLAQIARELVDTMRKDVRTDWTVREDVKARLRANVKRLLRKYKYPPDRAPEAVLQVMAQMEAMAPRLALRG